MAQVVLADDGRLSDEEINAIVEDVAVQAAEQLGVSLAKAREYAREALRLCEKQRIQIRRENLPLSSSKIH